MRIADLRLETVLGQRCLDPRNEIAAIGLVVGMLKLASAALGEVTAGRFLVMRPRSQGAIVKQDVPRHSERHVPPA